MTYYKEAPILAGFMKDRESISPVVFIELFEINGGDLHSYFYRLEVKILKKNGEIMEFI